MDAGVLGEVQGVGPGRIVPDERTVHEDHTAHTGTAQPPADLAHRRPPLRRLRLDRGRVAHHGRQRLDRPCREGARPRRTLVRVRQARRGRLPEPCDQHRRDRDDQQRDQREPHGQGGG